MPTAYTSVVKSEITVQLSTLVLPSFQARTLCWQDIVPQSLLENYLGMIDPSRAQTVDTEITKYCAYNLPAVAYTLGRKNWHCIKNLYETLAADMQVNIFI